jgi:serine-type D-Ala-D-Ala carboxypeptidase/endopeptidase (penicillin-binding protein 4)
MVLYALAEKYYGRGAAAKDGIKLIDSLISLAGHNPGDYVLADGSGVSHYNLISTELINDILKYFFFNQYDLYQKLYSSFPAAGVDGTLRTRMKKSSSENNVHAKTGTLSGVSSLSGYLSSTKGNLLSFSIMLQNYRGSAVKARYFQDTICNILTGF